VARKKNKSNESGSKEHHSAGAIVPKTGVNEQVQVKRGYHRDHRDCGCPDKRNENVKQDGMLDEASFS